MNVAHRQQQVTINRFSVKNKQNSNNNNNNDDDIALELVNIFHTQIFKFISKMTQYTLRTETDKSLIKTRPVFALG
jgi:hypothetical protein